MKGLLKKLGLCVLAGSAVFGLASCGDDPEPPVVETEADVKKAKDDALADLQAKFDALDPNSYDDATWNDFLTIKSYGDLFINGASSVANVNSNLAIITDALQSYKDSTIALANGVYSYVAASYDSRAEILGILESYAVANNLTGITVFEDAGYVMYNPIVRKGTENYIMGYGFGVLTEGSLTGDLAGEANSAWKRYWHTIEAEDPAQIYYGDDDGSVVGDLSEYIFGTYYGTFMNETKDGYEWVCQLAKTMPEPLNKNSLGLASKYRFEVKVGDDLKYSTLTSVPELAAFNNRPVALEDYITPYKLLHTQANGFVRAADGIENASGIKGLSAYYNASASGVNDVAWGNVALKTYVEGGKSYLELEFNRPCTEFYARYYCNANFYSPIPQDFLDIVKPEFWGKFDTTRNWSPVDTTLSTGAYVLERWDRGQQIVYKKNPNTDDGKHYQIEGVHINILTAAQSDPEATFKEFMADRVHACTIPATQIENYRDDPRTTKTIGTTTTKLNINTCTQDEWEKLFGKKGTITQTEPEDYWQCEPALSNEDFVKALSYAINRQEFAAKVARMPSANYFGTGYLADPEKAISYNSTKYHQAAMAELLDNTDGYGYNLELARSYFKRACETLLANGDYAEGDTIEIQIAWQSQSNISIYHNPIKQYWETAFNDASVCDGKLTLEIVDYVPASWSDVYYKKMMIGQFDIGFGGISGNALNPLNFFEVLKSDNSSGFTLNWGPDTSVVDPTLMWDGVAWSFDALWQVADTGGYVNKGKIVPIANAELVDSTLNADGTATFKVKGNVVSGVENLTTTVTSVKIYGYMPMDVAPGYAYDEDGQYTGVSFSYDSATDIVTVTISADLVAKYAGSLSASMPDVFGSVGLDITFTSQILGLDSDLLNSVDISLDFE